MWLSHFLFYLPFILKEKKFLVSLVLKKICREFNLYRHPFIKSLKSILMFNSSIPKREINSFRIPSDSHTTYLSTNMQGRELLSLPFVSCYVFHLWMHPNFNSVHILLPEADRKWRALNRAHKSLLPQFHSWFKEHPGTNAWK